MGRKDSRRDDAAGDAVRRRLDELHRESTEPRPDGALCPHGRIDEKYARCPWCEEEREGREALADRAEARNRRTVLDLLDRHGAAPAAFAAAVRRGGCFHCAAELAREGHPAALAAPAALWELLTGVLRDAAAEPDGRPFCFAPDAAAGDEPRRPSAGHRAAACEGLRAVAPAREALLAALAGAATDPDPWVSRAALAELEALVRRPAGPPPGAFRYEASTGVAVAYHRYVLTDDPYGPTYEVYVDGDTEAVTYFAPSAHPAETVVAAFHGATRAELRAALAAHAERRGWGTPAETAPLVDAILSHFAGSE